MLDTSDTELEAIVAHEIGHIKHNHINKIIPLSIFNYFFVDFLLRRYTTQANLYSLNPAHVAYREIRYLFITYFLSGLLTDLIINKRFEKEADEFAFKANKAEGIKLFFEHLLHKEKLQDDEFPHIYELLQESKDKVGVVDYYLLLINYYLTKGEHLVNKARRWLYGNTFLGAHPSHQARVNAARYLEQNPQPAAID